MKALYLQIIYPGTGSVLWPYTCSHPTMLGITRFADYNSIGVETPEEPIYLDPRHTLEYNTMLWIYLSRKGMKILFSAS